MQTETAEEGRKRKPQFIEETEKMEQARLVLGFSAAADTVSQRAALLLCNQILGGDGDSCLFRKVREEKGLCYDIHAAVPPMMPYCFLRAGIKAEDAKQAGKEMLACLQGLQKESVSKERLAQAKRAVLREYRAIEESPWAMVDFFAEQALQGIPLSLEAFLRRIRRTEREDVMRAAKRLRLQTVYLLGERVDWRG